MKKKINTTVAIAVYNAEKNLSLLLESLVIQKESNYVLKEIKIYSDCSSDRTNYIADTYAKVYSTIHVVKGKNRKGFAGVVRFFFQNNDSDVLVILNDDIFINDDELLSKLVEPFNNSKVGFVTGNPNPLPPVNFVQSAANSSFNAFYKMSNSLKNKNNKFTCDGKVMAFTRNFIKSLQLPQDKQMGNVDSYLYFSAITSEYNYKHVRKAKVYYRNPSNTKEYLKWMTRNNSNRFILKNIFGDIVTEEYKPVSKIWLFKFIEFIKNPFAGVYLLFISIYTLFSSRRYARNFNPLWESIRTTKN